MLLTRHRHACIVVGRASDRELISGIPPATPAYLGVHQGVFDALEPYRIVL